jgi:glycosyltransferase involved in cell wall biosynthesis
MKVLHVYKDYYPPVKGGIEGHINVLANGLKRRGVEPEVLVSNTRFQCSREEIDGVPVTRVPQIGRFTSAPLNYSFTAWLKRLAPRADLLHFHFPNPTAELSYLLARVPRPVLVTYHSDIVRQALLGKCYAPFLRSFLDRADLILATSPDYRRSSRFLSCYSHKTRVVPLGIDLDRFTLDQMEAETVRAIRRRHGGPLVLFIGRFRYYKGLHVLIDAMERVNGRLLLIGNGPLYARLRDRARRSGWAERIVFLGERSDREVVQFLHACDLFVLPSVQRSEAFGIVQLEAMACGKPLVCTAIGTGTTYVNQHGRTGWVVPPDDPRRLATAIQHLLDHPRVRERFGAAGRARVREEFSADCMTDRVLAAYQDVLERSPPPAPPAPSIRRPAPPVPSPPITVLRTISRLNIGGPAIHVQLLTQGLNRSRFRTVLVTGRISASEGNMTYLFADMDPKPLVVKTLQREISPLADLRAFWELYRIIQRERPDIVHTHTAKAGTSTRLAAVLHNRLRGDRVLNVHTFHGHVFEGYFSRLHSWLFINIERLLARLSDAIIAISDTQRRDLVDRFRIVPAEKVRTIPLGFQLAPFLEAGRRRGEFRRRLGISSETLLIGTIGRLVPIKHHRMFLDAARRFRDRNPELPVRFVVIGDGELRETLQERARELGMAGEIRFCGWERDVPSVYADLDILGLTSLNEGTPVSLIEAMAAGVPVIASAVGGVRDLLGLSDGEPPAGQALPCARGLVCRKGDAAGFVEGLAFLVREASEAQSRRIAAARRYVEDRFGAGRLCADIEALYEDLMTRREDKGRPWE